MMKKLSGEQEERRETLNTREAEDSYKRVLSRSTILSEMALQTQFLGFDRINKSNSSQQELNLSIDMVINQSINNVSE